MGYVPPAVMIRIDVDRVIEETEQLLTRVDDLLNVVRERTRGEESWTRTWQFYLYRHISRWGMYGMPFGEKEPFERRSG